VTRNERIAAVLRDIGLAENKGTGIRAMRDAMHRANLTAPLFESDRRGNTFSVTLLTHHLLGEEDVAWLGQFKDCALSEDEARALIVVREVGAINNASYRDINRLDTLTASRHLQRLRSLGLLEQRGRGTATYYVPGDRVRDTVHQRMSSAPPIQQHLPMSLPHRAAANPIDSPESTGLNPVDSGESMGSPSAGNEQLRALPSALGDAVRQLGRRSAHNDVRRVILDLCAWRPFQLRELAALLDRDRQYLLNSYLRPLVREGKLAYLHSENPSHPAQAYRTLPTGNA
jgi:ATP-dependent DNA helicase RecG